MLLRFGFCFSDFIHWVTFGVGQDDFLQRLRFAQRFVVEAFNALNQLVVLLFLLHI